MKSAPIAPWPLGIDMISEETALPPGSVVDALNGVFVLGGAFETRLEESEVSATKYHSVYEAVSGVVYAATGTTLGRFERDGSFVAIGTLMDSAPICFTELNNELVCSSTTYIYRVTNTVSLLEGFVTDSDLTEAAHKVPMPPGKYIKAWQGRLLTARGFTLYISDPLNYAMCDVRRGFVFMQSEIVFVEAFPTGVYVGTKKGVYFLKGGKPDDWTLELVDPSAPLADASATVAVADLQEKVISAQGMSHVAVWLSGGGFAFGLPSGAVIFPQADRIRLDWFDQHGSLQLVDGVITAIVQ